MSDCVVIDKSITDSWVWEDAERLKWWIDLQLMANDRASLVSVHGTRIVVLQWQLIASVADLSRRWRRSHPTIIRYLRRLEQDGWIERTTMYGKVSLITIVNISTNTPPHQPSVIQSKPAVQPENHKPSTSIEDATAIEKAMLKQSTAWVQVVCMQYHLSDSDFCERLDEFYNVQACLGNESTHQSITDAKRHFVNWLIRRKNTTNETTRERQDKRRGCDATAIAAEDYTTTF